MLLSAHRIFMISKLALTLLFGAPVPQEDPQQVWSVAPIDAPALIEVQVDLDHARRLAHDHVALAQILDANAGLNVAFEDALTQVTALSPLNPEALRAAIISTQRIGVWVYDHAPDHDRIVIVIDTRLKQPAYETLLRQTDAMGVTRAVTYRGLNIHTVGATESGLYIFQDRSRLIITTDELLIDQYLARRGTDTSTTFTEPQRSIARARVHVTSIYSSQLTQSRSRRVRDELRGLDAFLNIGAWGELIARFDGSTLGLTLAVDSRAPFMLPMSTLSGQPSTLMSRLSDKVTALVTLPINQPLLWGHYLFDSVIEVGRRLDARWLRPHLKLSRKRLEEQIIKEFIGVAPTELYREMRSLGFGVAQLKSGRGPLVFAEIRDERALVELISKMLRFTGTRDVSVSDHLGGTLIKASRVSAYLKAGLLLFSPSASLSPEAFVELSAQATNPGPAQARFNKLKRALPRATLTAELNLKSILQLPLSPLRMGLWFERGAAQSKIHVQMQTPPLKELKAPLKALFPESPSSPSTK